MNDGLQTIDDIGCRCSNSAAPTQIISDINGFRLFEVETYKYYILHFVLNGCILMGLFARQRSRRKADIFVFCMTNDVNIDRLVRVGCPAAPGADAAQNDRPAPAVSHSPGRQSQSRPAVNQAWRPLTGRIPSDAPLVSSAPSAPRTVPHRVSLSLFPGDRSRVGGRRVSLCSRATGHGSAAAGCERGRRAQS